MHNREFKFGYQHFLLCQKSFLKVSSKGLLKNKSDNGKLLLGKTYSGERFRAILALLFSSFSFITKILWTMWKRFKKNFEIRRKFWVPAFFFFFSQQYFLPYERQKPLLYPCKTNVFGCILESACLSVCPSMYKILVSVKAQEGVLSHIL